MATSREDIYNNLPQLNGIYKKVENLIVEATDYDLKEFENIQDLSLTSLPNKWSLLQSLKHINDNKVDGDIVETGVYRGANLILIKNFFFDVTLCRMCSMHFKNFLIETPHDG